MNPVLAQDDVLEKLKVDLEEMFEIAPGRVTLGARLYEDLDLDSIDAVDLIVRLQQLTNRKIRPDEFRAVRTVGDVVDCVHAILAE
jgi:acyl carrier protein